MNAQVNTQVAATVKAKAAYLVKQDSRKRYSFGAVWNAAVVAGAVSDKNKLVAQAVKLKTGKRSDLKKVKFATLLGKVQKALTATA